MEEQQCGEDRVGDDDSNYGTHCLPSARPRYSLHFPSACPRYPLSPLVSLPRNAEIVLVLWTSSGAIATHSVDQINARSYVFDDLTTHRR
jgi:hypothetical protein